MDLGKLRHHSTKAHYLQELEAMLTKYGADAFNLGDQDIWNVYGAKYPDRIHILPCEWNVRTDSVCRKRAGAKLLHGSRWTIHHAHTPNGQAFKAIRHAVARLQNQSTKSKLLVSADKLGTGESSSGVDETDAGGKAGSEIECTQYEGSVVACPPDPTPPPAPAGSSGSSFAMGTADMRALRLKLREIFTVDPYEEGLEPWPPPQGCKSGDKDPRKEPSG